MSSSSTPQPVPRRRGGTWRYAVPDPAGAGAAKFRDNLRRLGGDDLLAADQVPADRDGVDRDGVDRVSRDGVDRRRPARPRLFR